VWAREGNVWAREGGVHSASSGQTDRQGTDSGPDRRRAFAAAYDRPGQGGGPRGGRPETPLSVAKWPRAVESRWVDACFATGRQRRFTSCKPKGRHQENLRDLPVTHGAGSGSAEIDLVEEKRERGRDATRRSSIARMRAGRRLGNAPRGLTGAGLLHGLADLAHRRHLRSRGSVGIDEWHACPKRRVGISGRA
jgi:hypothetical protein